MIAKLITHAPDRLSAIEAQAQALDRFCIEGIAHNLPFLAELMRNPRFRAGDLSTNFVSEDYPKGFRPRLPEGAVAVKMAAVVASIDHVQASRQGALESPVPRAVLLGRTRYDVEVEREDEAILVRFAEGPAHRCVSSWVPGLKLWDGAIDGDAFAVQLKPILNGFLVTHGGTAAEAFVYAPRTADLAALMPERRAQRKAAVLLSPMPCLVKLIGVEVGQRVKPGDMLCILEAMKMEHVIRAEEDLTIKAIHVRLGDALALDGLIMEFD